MKRDRNVVGMDGRERSPEAERPPDFWSTQIEDRLNRIDAALSRLEWQIWLILCCTLGLMTLRLAAAFARL